MNDESSSPDHNRTGRPPVPEGSFSPPPPPPGVTPMMYSPPPPPRKSWLTRLWTSLLSVLLLVSILLNFYLGIIVASTMRGPIVGTFMEGDAEYRIVILPIEGMIDGDTYNSMRRWLQDVRKNPPKAIVLRVDSGGGLVGASDRIWHELSRFREDTGIPIIASFGSVAASGGYYVAAMADEILAEPSCITGSIGVMANVVTFDRLLQMIGVTPEVIIAEGSPHKDVANNVLRSWDERDRETVRFLLDAMHDQFVGRVYEGRKMHLSRDEVTALASGEVFTAEQARGNKLIDEVGYIHDAIARAAELGQIPSEVKPLVQIYRESPGFFGLFAARPGGGAALDVRAMDGRQLRRMVTELSTPQLEYRLHLLQP